SLSNCCPPNVVRTIAEVQNYAYSISNEGLWVNLYGGSNLSTKLKDGSQLKLTQESNYPWDGLVNLQIHQASKKPFSIFLRIPGWCKNASLKINGRESDAALEPGEYVEVNRNWKKGDRIELQLPMPVQLIEANPLVEETRNQVAVKRGPVVYCIESVDLPASISMFDIAIPAQTNFSPKTLKIDESTVVSLEGKAQLTGTQGWENQLYRPITEKEPKTIDIKLMPYFAWGNRGHTDMSVWMPLGR